MNNPLLQSVQVALQNGTQKQVLQTVEDIVDFCIKHENGKVLDGWERDTIKLLVAYHMAKDTLLVGYDADNKIDGVFMWYHCNSDDDWFMVYDWDADKPDGDAIFMAFVYAANKEALKKLTANFILKCPEAYTKQLLGIRYRQGSPKRVKYTTKLFQKILEI